MRFARTGILALVILLLSATGILAQDAGADDAVFGWLDDGKTLLFTSTRGGTADLYSMQQDGSDVQRLTTGKSIQFAVVSPDQMRVALGDENGLEVMTVADGSMTTLTEEAKTFGTFLAWSPDSSGVLYSTQTSDTEGNVMLGNLDGSEPINLTLDMLTSVCGGPVPDGKHFYVCGTFKALGSVVLYLYNLDGTPVGAQFNILSQFNYTGSPFDVALAWLPDGSAAMVSFAADPTIYRLDAQYGDYIPVIPTGGYVSNLRLSADGNTLLYWLNRTADPAEAGLYRFDLTKPLEAPELLFAHASVYGRWIIAEETAVLAYDFVNYDAPPAIAVISLEDGQVAQAKVDYTIAYQGALLPDATGAMVSICTNDAHDLDIYRVDAVTGETQNLTQDDAFSGDAVPSTFCP